jgi:hypothetical protein
LEWASIQGKYLLFYPKQKGTFHSARWKKDFTPDLSFVSVDHLGQPRTTTRTVLGNFPNSQHRPVALHIGIQLPQVKCTSKSRWDFRKADWSSFSATVDETIVRIPATPTIYERFVNILKTAAKRHIPRGFRNAYTPCWNPENEALLQQYENIGEPTTGKALLESLNSARRQTWI